MTQTNIEYVAELCNSTPCSSGVPDSWCDIVAECHKEMLATGIGFNVDQIKEKFDGLRFYYTSDENFPDEELDYIIRKAEQAVYNLSPKDLYFYG